SLFRGGGLVSPVASPSADKGLVRFDECTFAAERAGRTVIPHRLANAMPDEPASLEIDAKDAAKLICAEAFLRRAHQVHGLKPNMHRNVALLEDGSDLDGERL